MPNFHTRGFGIHYERYGEGTRTPLVLIMGMGGTCQGWTVTTVPELSKRRPVIIFDNRGAGLSEDPGTPFTSLDMAEDTLALLDELGLERAHVLGGFLGGMVAQELALAHPGARRLPDSDGDVGQGRREAACHPRAVEGDDRARRPR